MQYHKSPLQIHQSCLQNQVPGIQLAHLPSLLSIQSSCDSIYYHLWVVTDVSRHVHKPLCSNFFSSSKPSLTGCISSSSRLLVSIFQLCHYLLGIPFIEPPLKKIFCRLVHGYVHWLKTIGRVWRQQTHMDIAGVKEIQEGFRDLSLEVVHYHQCWCFFSK